MKFSADCMACLAKGQFNRIKDLGDSDKRAEYMRKVLLTIGSAPEGCTDGWMTEILNELYVDFWGLSPLKYEKEKVEYNRLMLEREPALQQLVLESDTPLPLAIKLARAGNYIDFGAKIDVQQEMLDQIIAKAMEEDLDPTVLHKLEADLAKAQTLVYLTDNCGEIVLDKILVKTLQRLYPQISLTVITRGKPVINDATVEDAIFVGMDKLAPVVGNGTAIPGTQLCRITPEARRLVEQADVIISKGMGNVETLAGSGLNAYYLFLCKCDYFVRKFRMPLLTAAFMRERDHDQHYWDTF